VQDLVKSIYETEDVLKIVLAHHKETKGSPPAGYEWVPKDTRSGVVVEPVKIET